MKLVGALSGRAGKILIQEDVQPVQGVYWPDVVKAIAERYEFGVVPDLSNSWEQISKEGLVFRFGHLSTADDQITVQELGIYATAIVVNASTTDYAELFLADLAKWGETSFGYRNLTNEARNFYVSEVVVEFEKPTNKILQGYESIASILNAAIKRTYDVDTPLQLSRFALSRDPETPQVPHILVDFVLERRLKESYEKERYYCQAPLKTPDHIVVLEAIEKAIQ